MFLKLSDHAAQMKVWRINCFLMNQKLRAVEADAVTAKVDTKAAREPATTVNSRPEDLQRPN
jgi:hypothetical protein